MTAVTTLLSAIRDHRVSRQADLPLLRLAVITDTLLGAEEPEEFLSAQRLLAREHLFRCQTTGAVGRRISAMVDTAQSRLRELAGLDAYAPDREAFMSEPENAFAA